MSQQSDEAQVDNPWGLDWQDLTKLFSLGAHQEGEWAGAVLPLHEVPVVLEPNHPKYKQLNGMAIVDGEIKENVRYERSLMYREEQRFLRLATPDDIAEEKLEKLIHTLAPCSYWTISAESNAIQKLASMVSAHRFKCYLCTGMFLETSERSGVSYLFRRCKPTIAFRHAEERLHLLACLCLHPLAYYFGTFAGGMVPTDDVIAHLTMMRGDERRYWSRANQHNASSIHAGL